MMKSITKNLLLSPVASCLLLSVSEAQGYNTGPVTITQIGCQTTNTTCYVYYSGPAVGPPGCDAAQVRWDTVNTPNGAAILAQLTAAYVAGKQVTFAIDNNCFPELPTYPQMDYYVISG